MSARIFVAFSAKDGRQAEKVCAALESRGLTCWISSRDVQPGANYQESIVDAIRAAKVMVLVFSANANDSNEIKKEVSLASKYRVVIIPVRLEDVSPSGAFDYELATHQWINLFDDWDRELEKLIQHIASIIPTVTKILPRAPMQSTSELHVASSRKISSSAKSASREMGVGPSVAVLPFMNLSGDSTQDFFSDGITVELTMALANLPGLLVIGRASAFEFKGRTDWHVIGQELGTTYLLQGTVQKNANKVRITAELFRAADHVPLWREKFNRHLTDIFEVQEGIAFAIASALHVPLGLAEKAAAVRNRTKDLESYDKYLRGKALIRARGISNLTTAAVLLEQAVASDSEYAPAWSMLAFAYVLIPNHDPNWHGGDVVTMRNVVSASLPRAEAAACRAIQLDPNDPYGHLTLGLTLAARGQFAKAEASFKTALALDPHNPDVLHVYSGLFTDVGRLNEALAMREKLLALEPFVPVYKWIFGVILWLRGRSDEAIALLQDLSPDDMGRNFYLGRIYATEGRYSEAADAIERIPYRTSAFSNAVRLLRLAPMVVDSPKDLPQLGSLGFVYLYIGAASRFLEFFEGSVKTGYLCNSLGWIWHPSYAHMRETERFGDFVKAAGLLSYWRECGWPDSECYKPSETVVCRELDERINYPIR